MYPSTPTTAAYLAAHSGYHAEILIWVKARNRISGAEEALGLWTGAEDKGFVIDGGTRPYAGAGAMLSAEPVIYAIGLDVRVQRFKLSGIDTTVAQMVRGFDARLAPFEMHRALFDLQTGALIDTPELRFRGVVDELSIHTPEEGGEGYIDLVAASQSRDLTRTLSLRKSDESQQLRGGDRFRQYGDVAGSVTTYWGEGGPSGGFAVKGQPSIRVGGNSSGSDANTNHGGVDSRSWSGVW